MTDPESTASMGAASDDPAYEPTQAEIDEWVARERKRRAEWLNGPTDEERAAYARGLRSRRISAAFDDGEARISDTVRMGVRLGREGQLAAEGAAAVLYRWSRRTFADLVRAGREWEEETTLPNVRRRVSMNDDES